MGIEGVTFVAEGGYLKITANDADTNIGIDFVHHNDLLKNNVTHADLKVKEIDSNWVKLQNILVEAKSEADSLNNGGGNGALADYEVKINNEKVSSDTLKIYDARPGVQNYISFEKKGDPAEFKVSVEQNVYAQESDSGLNSRITYKEPKKIPTTFRQQWFI